jgi:hypothetical protein
VDWTYDPVTRCYESPMFDSVDELMETLADLFSSNPWNELRVTSEKED